MKGSMPVLWFIVGVLAGCAVLVHSQQAVADASNGTTEEQLARIEAKLDKALAEISVIREVISPTPTPAYLVEYMKDLNQSIKRAWAPPRGQESRKISVTFKVHSDGTMSDLRIAKSSNVDIADQAALDAVKKAAPFRSLPKDAPAALDLGFTFDYNIKIGPSF